MKHLSQFALELRHSGYDVQFRKYVIDHAIIKYNKALIEHMNGTKCMFRNKKQREEDTKAKGGKKSKESWYKCSGRYTSIMVIPLTSGGCLSKKIQYVLHKYPGPKHTCAKMIEAPGRTIKDVPQKSDPFGKISCQREGCPLIYKEEGCRMLYYATNINYNYSREGCEKIIFKEELGDHEHVPRDRRRRRVIENIDDKEDYDDDHVSTEEEQKLGQYKGESSKTAFSRHKWHVDKAKGKKILDV